MQHDIICLDDRATWTGSCGNRDMTKKTRILRASLIAPLSALALPTLSCMTLLYSGPDIRDDAPYRAAGIILFAIVPIGYILLASMMALIGYRFSTSPRLSLRNLLIGGTTLSILIGIAIGTSSPFDIRDQLISFGIFLGISLICLSAGVTTWWQIAGLTHKEPFQPTTKYEITNQ